MALRNELDLSGEIPIAKIFQINQLKGWISKKIIVPPNRIGVAINRKGDCKTFEPGEHTLLSVIDRLSEKGVGLLVGYLPSGGFNIVFENHYLAAADGKLVNALFSISVFVKDPAKFLVEIVAPMGVLKEFNLPIKDDLIHQALNQFVGEYLAADLCSPSLLSTTMIKPGIINVLSVALSNYGLAVEDIPLMIFWLAEKDLDSVIKPQMIQEQINLLDHVENVNQVFDSLDQSSLRVDEDVIQNQGKAQKLKDGLTSFLKGREKQQNPEEEQAHWVLANLFKRRPNVTLSDAPDDLPRTWWVPRFVWVTLLLIVGILISYIVLMIGDKLNDNTKWGYILTVWGMILPLIFAGLSKLADRAEKQYFARAMTPLRTHLEDLAKKDIRNLDKIIRDQISVEFEHISQVINQLRERIYRKGDHEVALRLKQLESKNQQYLRDTKNQSIGKPAYLNLSSKQKKVWHVSLSYDEELLMLARSVSELVEDLRDDHFTDGVPENRIIEIEKTLDLYHDRFIGRSRIFK